VRHMVWLLHRSPSVIPAKAGIHGPAESGLEFVAPSAELPSSGGVGPGLRRDDGVGVG
jgi:hypothetical protein